MRDILGAVFKFMVKNDKWIAELKLQLPTKMNHAKFKQHYPSNLSGTFNIMLPLADPVEQYLNAIPRSILEKCRP